MCTTIHTSCYAILGCSYRISKPTARVISAYLDQPSPHNGDITSREVSTPLFGRAEMPTAVAAVLLLRGPDYSVRVLDEYELVSRPSPFFSRDNR